MTERPVPPCSHKFLDGKVCLRCGRIVEAPADAEEPPSTPRERPPMEKP